MCWPAGAAGAFFLGIIIMDIVRKEYKNLPFHGILGVCVTGILWLLCELIGVSVTAGILVIPAFFALIFFFTVWFMNESFKKQGCCMTCGSDATTADANPDAKPPKGMPRLVKKKNDATSSTGGLPDTITPPKVPTLSNLPGSGSAITCVKNKLTATPL
jgi:hypothetical protein